MGTPKKQSKPKAKAKSKPAGQAKRGRGRPSVYRPEFAAIAKEHCESGATDPEVAHKLGIKTATLYRWRHDHPEFRDALKAGKHPVDERVVRSLVHKALGYSYDSEEIFCQNGVVTRVPVVKHIPPDTTAMIFWLKNRRPADWRDRQEQVKFDVHMSLAELVNMSYRPDLPEPKVIEHDGAERDGTEKDGT